MKSFDHRRRIMPAVGGKPPALPMPIRPPFRNRKFADSLLEGGGFELSVLWKASPRCRLSFAPYFPRLAPIRCSGEISIGTTSTPTTMSRPRTASPSITGVIALALVTVASTARAPPKSTPDCDLSTMNRPR